MQWNWQQRDWSNFAYQEAAIKDLEARFIYNSGMLIILVLHKPPGQLPHVISMS